MRQIKLNILIIILFSTYYISSQTIDSLRIQLELNKTEYSKGDTVKLLIKNISNDTLHIYNPFFTSNCIILNKWNGQEWEELNIQGFSGGIRIMLNKYLPGEEINFNWNQDYNINIHTDSIKRISAPKGIYKFGFLFMPCLDYPNNEPVHILKSKYELFKVTYSEEFELK